MYPIPTDRVSGTMDLRGILPTRRRSSGRYHDYTGLQDCKFRKRDAIFFDSCSGGSCQYDCSRRFQIGKCGNGSSVIQFENRSLQLQSWDREAFYWCYVGFSHDEGYVDRLVLEDEAEIRHSSKSFCACIHEYVQVLLRPTSMLISKTSWYRQRLQVHQMLVPVVEALV
ncbi:hypothetical protein OUZ56_011886 [Daphnia magna]|uniref:Uncharacterized protein n=1 Tax=Daphnia magna TaxID=35525 RepID=A0ABQ9Z1I4_9CRUS|nr:hypothetical protein OUZ56_011886 [Daphnia magna]